MHPLDLKLLMNHRLPAGGDVTEGYVRPSVDHLRVCVETISEFLLEKADVAVEQRQRDAG